MGDPETMTVDYANIELAVKQCNPSLVWRSGQERQLDSGNLLTIIAEFESLFEPKRH